MRRHLLSASLAALMGLFLLASDASACHKRRTCAQPCATTVVVCPPPVYVQPCPPPPPVCPPPVCVQPVVCPQPVACAEPCARPAKRGHRLAGLRGRLSGRLGGHRGCR